MYRMARMEMDCNVFKLSFVSKIETDWHLSLVVPDETRYLVSVFDSFDRKFKNPRDKAPFTEVIIEKHFLVSGMNLRTLPRAFTNQNEARKGKGNL